jgi:hypothetical protein
MNDMTQAPKANLALNALLANLERICKDPWLSTDEKVALALQTAKASTSLVAHSEARTPRRDANGRALAREALREKVFITLHDGQELSVEVGFPGWLEP